MKEKGVDEMSEGVMWMIVGVVILTTIPLFVLGWAAQRRRQKQ
ncbi:hypothetical protein [Mechercharimyces sp. CAU 1602]|nr:hypothetical protein [Mechercharimyces sp. CAU 1602]MCS1350730.1 hypothetical protein [Mechercharimyces sp. CAU 1602]